MFVLYWFESNEDGGDCGPLYGSHNRKTLENKKDELTQKYKEQQQKHFEYTTRQAKDIFIQQIRQTLSASGGPTIWNIEDYLDMNKVKTPKPEIKHFQEPLLKDNPPYVGELIIEEVEVI